MDVSVKCLQFTKKIIIFQERHGFRKKRSVMNAKGRKTLAVKWVFKSKEEHAR